MKCPCKGCYDRTITRHIVCRAYKEWKQELEKTNEQKIKAKTDCQSQAAKRWFWKRLRWK